MNQNRPANISQILFHPQNLHYVCWYLSNATSPFTLIIFSRTEQPETALFAFFYLIMMNIMETFQRNRNYRQNIFHLSLPKDCLMCLRYKHRLNSITKNYEYHIIFINKQVSPSCEISL